MARNIVLGWMVLLLERSRSNPMTAMVVVLTNTGARHRNRAAGGIVVSAALSDGSAGWSQEQEEVRAPLFVHTRTHTFLSCG